MSLDLGLPKKVENQDQAAALAGVDFQAKWDRLPIPVGMAAGSDGCRRQPCVAFPDQGNPFSILIRRKDAAAP